MIVWPIHEQVYLIFLIKVLKINLTSAYRLTAQIESLDQRCEELQRSLDDLTVQQESARRRQRRSLTTPDTPLAPTSLPQAPSLPPVTSTVDEEEVLTE